MNIEKKIETIKAELQDLEQRMKCSSNPELLESYETLTKEYGNLLKEIYGDEDNSSASFCCWGCNSSNEYGYDESDVPNNIS